MDMRFFSWAIVYGASFFLIACSNEQTSNENVRFVKVAEVSEGSEARTYSFNGVIREKDEIDMAFRVGGQIVKLLVDEGDPVRSGQIIALLDDRDYKVQYDAANAVYIQAKNEFDRYKELFNLNKLPKNTLDKLESACLAAKSNFDAASNALHDTQLKAPFDGFVTKRAVANYENVAPGQPIVSLIDDNALEVRFSIPVDLVEKVKSAKSLICDFSVDGLCDVPAKFISINQKASSNDQYDVRLQLVASNASVKSGMTTKVRVISADTDHQALSVSLGAIFYANNLPHVWVVNHATMMVQSQPISLGKLMGDGRVEVIGGLEANGTIVVAGVNSLKENQRVKIQGS